MLDETIQNLGVEVLILPTVNFVDPVRGTSPQTRTLTRTRTLLPTRSWSRSRSRSRSRAPDRTRILTQPSPQPGARHLAAARRAADTAQDCKVGLGHQRQGRRADRALRRRARGPAAQLLPLPSRALAPVQPAAAVRAHAAHRAAVLPGRPAAEPAGIPGRSHPQGLHRGHAQGLRRQRAVPWHLGAARCGGRGHCRPAPRSDHRAA
eukprot:scaffold88491_cov63-Phaeocystis_antarctica.AAC.4